jgi:hypothetical protein
MSVKKRTLLLCLVAVLCVGTAGATTLVKMEFADLAREADRVVIGTVTHTEGIYDASGSFIHTLVNVDVKRYVTGTGPASLVIQTPGGQIGDEGMVAHGAATFEVGETALIFLTSWEDGTPKVLGYVQGKSTVQQTSFGEARLKGGVAGGRSLRAVVNELVHGPDHTIPLRRAN